MDSHDLYVGIDVSKLKHDIAVIDDQKKLLTPCFAIRETAAGYDELFERLIKIQNRCHATHVNIGMEATGEYWKNLYHFFLNRTDWPVTVINPMQTRHFAKSQLRRAKTDSIDAVDIARYMQERQPAPTPPRTFGLQAIRDIDRQILSLVKERNANIYRLRLELGKTFPELEQKSSSLTARRVLILLQHYPTAESIRNTPAEKLYELNYDGNKKRRLPTSFLNQVKALAQNSIACKYGANAGIIVQALAQRINQINQHIIWLQKNLVTSFRQQNGKPSILATIPGIAPLTATILEAYIGDVNRFANYKKMVAYFGMNPTVHLSGKATRSRSRLEKKGHARVRGILFLNTLTMIRFKVDPIYSFYQRKVDEGKPKMVALCAAMRKLLVIIYEMLKNNEPFRLEK